MGPFILTLLLITPLIHAKIDVQVEAGSSLADSAVKAAGNIVNLISDEERNTFKLSDNLLKNAIEKYYGKRPDDAYLRSPTPWGDLYRTYSWREVTRILTPIRTTILSLKSEPAIVSTQHFENNSSMPASFTATIQQEVANTLSSAWEKGGELSIGNEIEYSVDFKAIKGGGKTSLSYTAAYGESQMKSETLTVGSMAGVKISLDPHQSVKAELYATRGKMRVKVDYEASLSGVTAINYSRPYKGHHFFSLDINQVMRAGDVPRTVRSSEIIEIGFYTESKVVIKDLKKDTYLYSLPLSLFIKKYLSSRQN